MIRVLRATLEDCEGNDFTNAVQIVLLYGVRDRRDILMKELLDNMETNSIQSPSPDAEECSMGESKEFKRFKVVYCIGSRWSNVIMGAKTSKPKGVSVYLILFILLS